MLHRGSFAQRGAAALGFELGAERVLERFVFPDRQTPPFPDPRGGTRVLENNGAENPVKASMLITSIG